MSLFNAPQCIKNQFGIRVIGRVLANMAEDDFSLPIDYKRPWKLTDVADWQTNTMALDHSSNGLEGNGRGEEIKDRGGLKTEGLEELLAWIGDQRERSRELPGEGRRFFLSPHTNQNHLTTSLLDL